MNLTYLYCAQVDYKPFWMFEGTDTIKVSEVHGHTNPQIKLGITLDLEYWKRPIHYPNKRLTRNLFKRMDLHGNE